MPEMLAERPPAGADKAEAVEPRSEEVRAMLGTVPHWTIRLGQGYLLALLASAFLITWFIRYPDEIAAPIVVTAREAPAGVVARSAGHLVLWAKDNQRVRRGEYLGYLTSPASVEVMLELKKALAAFQAGVRRGEVPPFDTRPFDGAELGEVQDEYTAFTRAVRERTLWSAEGMLRGEREALAAQVAGHRALIARAEASSAILREEVEIARAQLGVDSALYARELTSRVELMEKRRAYLAARREHGGQASSVATLRLAVAELEDRIRQSGQEERRRSEELASSVQASMRALDEAIQGWETAYMLRTPMDGRVALYSFWRDHHYIKPGDEVLTVVSEREDGFFGIVDAPVDGSGKIVVGQRVDIELADYPPAEYGRVQGVVGGISLVPREKVYRITIHLPDGLTTRHGRKLRFRQEMSGTATIVTRDQRLLERIFFQARRHLST